MRAKECSIDDAAAHKTAPLSVAKRGLVLRGQGIARSAIVKKHIRSFAVVDPPTVSLGRPDPRAAHVQTALRERWRGQPPASQRVASAGSLSAW